MQITVIEIILSFPWRWSRGICWEMIKWCLFSTQMWGSRAASASGKRICCSSRLVPVLLLPLSTQHQGKDHLQRFKSRSHFLPSPQYDFSIVAVCPFLFASFFVHPSIRGKASPARDRVRTGGDSADETQAGSGAASWKMWNVPVCSQAVVSHGTCLGGGLVSTGFEMQERDVSFCSWEAKLVWWRDTKWIKCRLRAKIQDVMLWG